MSAEAEATDVLVRMTMEGMQYCFRFAGTAATKGLALLFAGTKALYEMKKGRKKLGGKMNTRAFLDNFVSSSVFPLSQSDMEKLKPELKRLHIPYMQYKTTKEMKADGRVEISVRKDDAERFVRLAESLGIASVKPYDIQVEEMSNEEYEQALKDGTAKGVDVKVSEDGITVNEKENPSQAPTDLSPRSEPSSDESKPFDLEFKDGVGIDANLQEAYKVAARRDGRLIPISANRERLFVSEQADSVTVIIPGTKQCERLVIPKSDIVSMTADGGKSVRADLRDTHLYEIVDKNNNPIRKSTGSEIKDAGNWTIRRTSRKKSNIPLPQKGGAR